MTHLEPAVILADLALILVAARLVGWLFTRIGQPAVVGEILAGVLLGPTLLGSSVSGFLFPEDQRGFLSLLADLGLVLFMFIVGLELDVSLVRGRGRVAGVVSVCSVTLPFAFGVGLATLLADSYGTGDSFWAFALFIGSCMSVTAFPVLARILTDRNIHRTETGGLALACAAVDDVLAWTLLAVVIAFSGAQRDASWTVALAVPFAVFVLLVVRPQLHRLTTAYQRAGRLTPGILAVVLTGILVCSAATEVLDVHFIFGAFLFGAVMPREGAASLRHEILVRLEQVSVLLLLPVFFLLSGLEVDLRRLSGGQLVELALILLAAIGGKFAGAYIGATLTGVPRWQARALGTLMNTRGLTELVILSVGLEAGLIDRELFAMLVVMALVTTIMTGPLLRRVYPDRRVARDIAAAERAAMGTERGFTVLVVGGDDAATRSRLGLARSFVADQRPAEIVLSALQPFPRTRLEVGSGLTDELASMTATMDALEEAAERARASGVQLTVLNRFSQDVAADQVAQVETLEPDVVLVAADDPAADELVAHAEPVLAVLPGGPVDGQSWAAVEIAWAGTADDDAAVQLGARISSYLGAPIVLRPQPPVSARRVNGLANQLRRAGVEVADAVPPGKASLRLGALAASGVDVAVRAQRDPEPVDWARFHVARPAPRPPEMLGT